MNEYQLKLKEKMDEFVLKIYEITDSFPKQEQFGITSQIRRSSLSIILNYIEGYARESNKARLYFLDIAFGSAKETEYTLQLSYKLKYFTEENYLSGKKLLDEIMAMLWTEKKNIKKYINNKS